MEQTYIARRYWAQVLLNSSSACRAQTGRRPKFQRYAAVRQSLQELSGPGPAKRSRPLAPDRALFSVLAAEALPARCSADTRLRHLSLANHRPTSRRVEGLQMDATALPWPEPVPAGPRPRALELQ